MAASLAPLASTSVEGKTVLFVGAGRHQRRAIRRVLELGVRVVAVDRNVDAPSFEDATVGEPVDFQDVDAVAEVGRRHAVDGVMTVSADRAVPVVAAVAERLGLPGIGSEAARRVTHKVAMRRALAEQGVAQPRFAAIRNAREAGAAAATVGFPAVLKAADSAGQRGLFRVDSQEALDKALPLALAESTRGEAILERYHEGREVNVLALARGDDVSILTLSDRVRPAGVGFGVATAHVFPAALDPALRAEVERVAVHAIHALGLRDSIAYPQLLLCDDGVVRVVELAARIPGGQMAAVAEIGAGINMVELQLRLALGAPIPDALARPRFEQPLAISFLTASPGALPVGRVRAVGPLDLALEAPGVVHAETYIEPGETIRPVQRDGDRRGYVIATGATGPDALRRAEAASRLIEVAVEPAPVTA
jgi:biotin carboxylase